jgi:Putative bacterial sensory transduction regulator
MSTAPRASACAATDVEAWLGELGLEPLERADREGVTSWDLVLDGRRRARLRITVILDPGLALICWAHYAPPINDGFRRSYRKLLRWNDELPFVKFSIGEDERPLLVAEIPPATATRDVLGLALARHVAVADRYHDETVEWLKAGGWSTAGPAAPGEGAAQRPGEALLVRYAAELTELLDGPGGPGARA